MQCSNAIPPSPLLVTTVFVTHLFTFGPLYAFGVFLPPLRDHFHLSIDAASAVHSVMVTSQFVGGVLAGILMPHYLTQRTVALACSLWVTAGFAWASYVQTVTELFLAMAPIGFGLGMFNLAALTTLNTLVKERRPLAIGYATSGTSVGTICWPPIYSMSVESSGWRWALRISGASTGVALALCALTFRLPLPKPDSDGNMQRPPRACSTLVPCADTRYLLWWLNMVVSFLGYFSPVTLLAQFARDELDMTSGEAAVMYTAIGLGAFATRVCLGCITAQCGGARRVHLIAQVANGVLATMMPFCWDRASLLVWSIVYGFSVGPVIALISVILTELFGVEKLPFYQGVSRLGVGVGTFAGPPMIGALAENYGYKVALLVAGALVCGSAPFLLTLAVLDSRRLSHKQVATQDEKAGSRDTGFNSSHQRAAPEVLGAASPTDAQRL